MGISEMTVIDQNVKSFGLLPCDKLLLCSDGIYGSLNEEEMTEAMRLDTHFAALDLEERVLKKSFKGQDNMTAVVIGIN
jgi:serine/threonine protein phosphatase PrpC